MQIDLLRQHPVARARAVRVEVLLAEDVDRDGLLARPPPRSKGEEEAPVMQADLGDMAGRLRAWVSARMSWADFSALPFHVQRGMFTRFQSETGFSGN
jgi:hypothetical protein